MKHILLQAISLFIFFFIAARLISSPVFAGNYGDGQYGSGSYNVGETTSAIGETTPIVNTSISTTSPAGVSGCSDAPPGAKAPWLYGAVSQSSTTILLYFSDADDPVDHYVLEFGTKSGEYPWGATNVGKKGIGTVLVQSLSPNTTYYFRVRGGNGCATGSWSNEISAKTKGIISFNQLAIAESKLESIASTEEKSSAPETSCETYVVQPGDILWNIASKELGNGNKYKDIIEQNKEDYPSLNTSNSVSAGWELKLNCGESTSATKEMQKQEQKVVQGGYVVNVKVTDKKQQPVKGAKVTMHSKVQETTTDVKGIAKFENVEPGEHKVLISYNGFDGEQSINLIGDVKEFNLNITVVQKNILATPLVLAIIGGFSLVVMILIFLLLRSRSKKRLNS